MRCKFCNATGKETEWFPSSHVDNDVPKKKSNWNNVKETTVATCARSSAEKLFQLVRVPQYFKKSKCLKKKKKTTATIHTYTSEIYADACMYFYM